MSGGWIRSDWQAPAGIVAGTTLRDSDFRLPAEPAFLRQVHGARVVHYGAAEFGAGPPEADAIVADTPGSMCVVRTADCLPILLCSADGREIAAAHGGWRGLAAGIIEATLAAMTTPAKELLAWFGPAISQPAFEVGGEVRAAFLAHSPAAAAAFARNDRGRWQADLYALAAQRLQAAGVGDISGGGLCTFNDAERFYSYRRERTEERMLSFIFRGA